MKNIEKIETLEIELLNLMELYKDLIHENKILKNKNNKLETKLSKISKELEEEKNYHCAWSNVRKKDII